MYIYIYTHIHTYIYTYIQIIYTRSRAPGPDGTTAELYKWLDPHNKTTLLDTINECWNNETLHTTMNEANLAIIYKKTTPSYHRTTDLYLFSTWHISF